MLMDLMTTPAQTTAVDHQEEGEGEEEQWREAEVEDWEVERHHGHGVREVGGGREGEGAQVILEEHVLNDLMVFTNNMYDSSAPVNAIKEIRGTSQRCG